MKGNPCLKMEILAKEKKYTEHFLKKIFSRTSRLISSNLVQVSRIGRGNSKLFKEMARSSSKGEIIVKCQNRVG
jgi:hypothetical protein